MKAGLHVLTEKLMGHSVRECKEMAMVAKTFGRHLATGHQRHYSILYANAIDLVQRGLIGALHCIRAQWHRGNLPGDDSWQQPMPKNAKPKDALSGRLLAKRKEYVEGRNTAAAADKKDDVKKFDRLIAQKDAQIADEVLGMPAPDGKILAETFGYEARKDHGYDRPAIEELIRWRLFDRTGGGLMAELGSHQLDAASIFISAMHAGVKQQPLSVVAAANRPLFATDRDVDDHVYCVFEFPGPGYYDDKAPAPGEPRKVADEKKKIGVQYASINGNGFGGYGETVLGTKGTLMLEKETEVMLFEKGPEAVTTKVRPKFSKSARGPVLIDGADPQSAAIGAMALKDAGRGYQQQLEHWAWCIRRNPLNQDPDIHPRCYPKVAMADAVIALTTNIAAKGSAEHGDQPQRIVFDPDWFDPDSPKTPENPKDKPELRPDPDRYETA